MKPQLPILTVTAVWLLFLVVCAHAWPEKVTKREEAQWLRRLIPLPKQVAIRKQVTLPARDVVVRARDGASDGEKHAAAELAALLEVDESDLESRPAGDESASGFEILIGVCDEQGRLDGTAIPGAGKLRELPNSEQAYVIRPMGRRGLALTALDDRGVYYASRTLCQLLAAKLAGDTATIPLTAVTDWPDIAERGEWGGSASRDIEWMAAHKLNLVEVHAGLGLDDGGKGVATIDEELVELGRLRALKVVPIIMHLDYLRSSGLYQRWPEVQGVGEAARASAGGDPVALCFNQPRTTAILTDWMMSLAEHKGVTDINVWLSEYQGRCECPDCTEAAERGVPQHAREAEAVGQALEAARRKRPDLGARILLTQGTYPHNDKVLAAAPPDVQVTYYCGGGQERSTYNSSRDPMIYPLLEEYAASGRWLGVYPQFTASYGTVCPWSGPHFIRRLMGEFAQKGIDCVCGYTVPNNQLHDFNVTAAAEWSWNATGRSEREFAVAWATRRGIENPEAVGDWVELLGPVGWNIYGAGPAATPFLSILQRSAGLVAQGQKPALGSGIWRYYRRAEELQRDVKACADALGIAERLGVPELLHETRLVQAYATMLRDIHTIGSVVAEEDLASDEVRARLQEAMCRLAGAGVQGVKALQAWKEGISPDLRVARFDGTVRGTERTVVAVADALLEFGIRDPSKPYRRHRIGQWDDAELGEHGGMRLTWEIEGFPLQPGRYQIEFDYTKGQNGLPIRRVAIASAPQGRPEELAELNADEHEGFAGHEDRSNVYHVSLASFDPGLRYFVIADVTMPSSTAGIVYVRADAEPPAVFPVPDVGPLSPEQRELLESRFRGPEFVKGGLRVGVVQNGYGARGILEALGDESEMDAQPVWRLTEDAISRCQVLVLPQPRSAAGLGEREAGALAEYVRRGGGLITTHNAVGYRGYSAPVPEVCVGGDRHVRDRSWVVVGDHPTTKGIAAGRALTHGYYDHIELNPRADGVVVAESPSSGKPIIVCGAYGKGRYVACGLAIGLDPQDRDIVPSGPEKTFLINAIRWSGDRE